MSMASKPVMPKPETAKPETAKPANPNPVTSKRVTSPESDHEHVGKISTQTTIFVLIAIALILYEIQWILPPFVLAGVLAYVSTPAIEWSSARSGLPRSFVALAIFAVFLTLASVIGYFGIPPFVRAMTHVPFRPACARRCGPTASGAGDFLFLIRRFVVRRGRRDLGRSGGAGGEDNLDGSL